MGALQDMQRNALVSLLKKEGIEDERVLSAIGRVKREMFVMEELRRYAYDNVALPLEGNQTISQPFTVAFMTQLLDVYPGCKVLEVGTGSGYQSAVLKEMGAEVFSVERVRELYTKAKSTLNDLGYKIFLRLGDGSLGWQEFAPYDRIIVTAGAPEVPESLKSQLSMGGKMAIPVGNEFSQEIFLITKNGSEADPVYSVKKFYYFRFVPLVGKEGWKDHS